MSEALFERLDPVRERIRATEHVLLALDFDGTLAPICEHPGDVQLPAPTRWILHALAEQNGTWVVVISGRAMDDLRERVGLNIIYAANHGLEISGPGMRYRDEQASGVQASVRAVSRELAARLRQVAGVSVEDKGLTATVHFRQAAPARVGEIRRVTEDAVSAYPALHVLPAQRAWEIRPRLLWNKGSAVGAILRNLHVLEPLPVCIGDDETDEDMFDAPDAITIKVGHRSGTRAQYHVDGPPDVSVFLGLVHTWVAGSAPRRWIRAAG